MRSDNRQRIVEQVKRAGIVGAGGAGFPTHVKLSAQADVVIANGAECEPLLESDRHLLLREPGRIINGLKLVVEAVGAVRGVLAIKAKHEDILFAIKPLIDREPDLEIFQLQDFYPAGDEHVLTYEVTGRVVPMGGLPVHVGVVVDNVFTLAAIAGAMSGESFTWRYVTVAGEVNRPGVARLPVGLPIRAAIDQVGQGFAASGCRVLIGGPMMGRIEDNLEAPVTKTTNAILVLPGDSHTIELKTQDHMVAVKRSRSVCCQCRFCTDMCPRYLLGHNISPHKSMRVFGSAEGHFNEMDVYTSSLCSECGLCGYFACTMGLQPNIINGIFKQALLKNKIKADFADQQLMPVNPFRDGAKIPVRRLINRLGILPYSRHLPFLDVAINVDQLVLPLRQHTGAPCLPVIQTGDKVKEGELIAVVPAGSLGANLHSPLAGTMTGLAELSGVDAILIRPS